MLNTFIPASYKPDEQVEPGDKVGGVEQVVPSNMQTELQSPITWIKANVAIECINILRLSLTVPHRVR